MSPRRPSPPELPPAQLMQLPVAVDLIRFEKNLLQIGFFGAHDTRHNNQSTRRIEQWVNRSGQKIKVSAEFRGSGALGLPSTSDRDKYIAFMKIVMDQRAKQGRVENPIRFTGYQMLKELSLTYSGENYDDINRWGQRMADTTITSEQVIYLAARKKYANKTVHVFRSFLRSGKSSEDGSSRAEYYEVMLEDWLLENLNQSYVIPEDFNTYRQLKRPTAKGIFGYLHLWFHASQGRPVEKDYTELCMMLNIPTYRHLSKIRETMGRSLDELTAVGYLSAWDIRPMVTKEGFKLVLQPGNGLLHVLAISQRKHIEESRQPETAMDDAPPETPPGEQQKVIQALMQRGISETKAQAMARKQDAAVILDQIEYAEYLLGRDRRGKIENPAGFLIYTIENKTPVPESFVTSRRREQHQAATAIQAAEQSYEEFVRGEIERELERRFPGAEIEQKLKLVISNRVRGEEAFRLVPVEQQRAWAQELLRAEIREQATWPTLEEWMSRQEQLPLFQ
jgi:hypothetical protein